MPERPHFSRWDPLNPTNIIIAVLLGFALTVYHRPHLPLILPSYRVFDDVAPWSAWGWTALFIAATLLLTPRGGLLRLVAHALAGIFFLCVSTAFSAGVGLTSAATTYTVLASVSGVLFARTAAHWASGMNWWQQMVECPPRWLRWLARVDEFDRKRTREG